MSVGQTPSLPTLYSLTHMAICVPTASYLYTSQKHWSSLWAENLLCVRSEKGFIPCVGRVRCKLDNNCTTTPVTRILGFIFTDNFVGLSSSSGRLPPSFQIYFSETCHSFNKIGGGCALITKKDSVRWRKAYCSCTALGGTGVGPIPGEQWSQVLYGVSDKFWLEYPVLSWREWLELVGLFCSLPSYAFGACFLELWRSFAVMLNASVSFWYQ